VAKKRQRLPLLAICNSLVRRELVLAVVSHITTTTWFFRVLAHEPDLRAFLSRSLSHQDDVSDVVQETYARLLALSPQRRGAVRIWRAFLFATAHNIAMDQLRRRAAVSFESLPETEVVDVVLRGGEARTPDEIVNLTQERRLLEQVMASLPAKCRQVLTLRKVHGLSYRQIALRMGIAEHTVEKHVSHGIRLCAVRLLEATGTPQAGAHSYALKSGYPSAPGAPGVQ
jgi:RNA polymerase sigma factor (sigma-70 family)